LHPECKNVKLSSPKTLSDSKPHNDNENQPRPRQPGKHAEDFPIQEYRLVPVEEWNDAGTGEDEIDLIELANTIWEERKTIYKFVAGGVILGLLIFLLTPNEYKAAATLMPEYATEAGGGSASQLLQQYGGLLGLSGGGSYASNSNAIRVELYPNIAQSLPFQLALLEEKVTSTEYDTTVTVYKYFSEVYRPSALSYVMQYTIGLPFLLKNALIPKDTASAGPILEDTTIVNITEEQIEVIENMRGRVTVNIDEESGIVTVSSKMPESLMAAKLGNRAIELLTGYLKEYRTEKVRTDLVFVEEQLQKARERFQQAQLALAEFDDSNQGNLTARARTERQQLQSQYDLAFNLYNSLSQQYEQAKLKVQEQTPVFKTLQPVQVPVDDETSGALILIVSVMLAGMLSLGWIFVKKMILDNRAVTEGFREG